MSNSSSHLHSPFNPASSSTEEEWRAVHYRSWADNSVTGKHIYDLAWSPDSEFLIAGSTDNTASIWKAGTGMSLDLAMTRLMIR
jgi:WD40 repeat protein